MYKDGQYDKPDVTYNGKTMSYYAATQEQRKIERSIRHWKRQEAALKSSGQEHTTETAKVRKYQDKMKDFLEQTGLHRQREREVVYNLPLKSKGISDTIKDNEAVKTTLHTVEENKRNFDYEVGTIVDRKGNILDVTDGDKSSVNPPVELLKGNIFTHNHPSGGTFSTEDVKSFVKYEAYAVRASTPQGIVYSLKHTGKHDIKFADDMDIACTVANAHQLLKDDITLGKYTAEYAQKNIRKLLFEYLDNLSIDWLKKNAKKYGYIFEVGDI